MPTATTPPAKNSAFKWLLAVAELPASMKEKAILWPLALHADSDGFSYPGETTLCRETGMYTTASDKRKKRPSKVEDHKGDSNNLCGERTLRRWLRRLERKGWIQTARNSRPVKVNGRTLYLNVYHLTIPLRRADSIVSAHDPEMGGQIGHDGRTKSVPLADKLDTMGGHSCVRQTTSETSSETSRVRKSGSVTRKNPNEFVSTIRPRIIQ